MGTTNLLRYEQRGAVVVLTVDRPERLNAIGRDTLTLLNEALDRIEADPGTRVVIVTGEGKAFSAGADITELDALDGPHSMSRFLAYFTDTYDRLVHLAKPSIAAVNGMAFGGGLELALACDLRVVARSARLGVPEIKLGLLPGAGGSQRLARLLPAAVAKQLLLTGEPISADDAHRLGLVNEVVDDGTALATAERIAERLADGAPLALAAAKRLVDLGGPMALEAGVAFERETVAMLFATEDRAEGVAAFLEKRSPQFRGR
jgi:enoyl-CoA hydratase